MLRAQYRHNFRQLYLAYPCQGIENLLLFVFKLIFIVKTLPLAATAYAIMLTERNSPLGRIFMKRHSLGFGIAVFLTTDLKVRHITRDRIGNKNH